MWRKEVGGSSLHACRMLILCRCTILRGCASNATLTAKIHIEVSFLPRFGFLQADQDFSRETCNIHLEKLINYHSIIRCIIQRKEYQQCRWPAAPSLPENP